MNDKSQVEFHSKLSDKGMNLDPEMNKTDEGYQALCPICPWTSGVRDFKGSVKLIYYRHLEYIDLYDQQTRKV